MSKIEFYVRFTTLNQSFLGVELIPNDHRGQSFPSDAHQKDPKWIWARIIDMDSGQQPYF